MRVSIDSRTIEPGDYFIPVKGPQFDGRDFIQDALQKGGRLLDVDLESYAKKYRRRLTCAVIGVTGSAGKTTTKDLLASVFSVRYNVVKTKENQNNEVGVPLTVLSADDATDILIVEMGVRHPKDMARLVPIVRPTHVVITTIGLSHIENFRSTRHIATEKGQVFKLRQAWETASRFAYINRLTSHYEYLERCAKRCDYTVSPYEGFDPLDTMLTLCYMMGRQFSLTEEEIKLGLSRFSSSAHRLKKIQKSYLTIIDDSYNANPDGVKFALDYLNRFSGRKILVLGDMLELGDRSSSSHELVMSWCEEVGVSVLFTFGEATRVMRSDVVSVTHVRSKQALHDLLRCEVKAGDVVLVKGSRGMKMEETVAFLQQHFD